MSQSFMQTLAKITFKNSHKERWIHTMSLGWRKQCPDNNCMCLIIWDDGEIHTNCKYAKVTNIKPDMIQVTHTGKQIGMRCIPSNAIDFILKED